ncbi:MAG: GTP-binding protein [Candidatus Omnitrophota bacterium]
MIEKKQMNVVIVGHVDHGKSTLIGRLLADTGSLPEGKLDQVKAMCKRNSKPFEYAFLLDALKDEQSQGITIDTARSFFKSEKRDYIIIDAPGHIEFLKNMVTGAARAEAAMLVIDANEGIKENSKRHGYMMSFLGIKNVTVCVNKMDLVKYSEQVFESIHREYSAFLAEINLKPQHFIPISAREGDNIVTLSDKMPWYKGLSALEAFDDFKKAPPKDEMDVRFPIQDIYKFTEEGDDRRIFSGRIEAGTIAVGDEVVFLPSKKMSTVKSIEGFNLPKLQSAFSGQSTGLTLETQIYIKPGEILSLVKQKKPHVSTKFKANLFWMGKQPFVKGKNYKLKLSSQQVPVVLSEIISVLDASELSSISNKPQIDRHDVAECILETLKPVAFDEVTYISETGRFVIVDNYEISGGGIILAPVFEDSSTLKAHIKAREHNWERSDITPSKRAHEFKHNSAFVIITGAAYKGKLEIAKALEKKLFDLGKLTYFLGISNELLSTQINSNDKVLNRVQIIQQLGEMAHVMTDAGLIFIARVSDVDRYELDMLRSLNQPNRTVVVNVGENPFDAGQVDLVLDEASATDESADKITDYLLKKILPDPEFSI